MSIQFKTEKSLNVAGMKLIPIKTNDDKQVFVKTGKYFSFGEKKIKNLKQFLCHWSWTKNHRKR